MFLCFYVFMFLCFYVFMFFILQILFPKLRFKAITLYLKRNINVKQISRYVAHSVAFFVGTSVLGSQRHQRSRRDKTDAGGAKFNDIDEGKWPIKTKRNGD
jgi:hypothetical protein